MGLSHKSSRAGRAHRRPDVEGLEIRRLLSLTDPIPATSANALVRADGTVNNDAVIQASAARATYGVDGAGSNVAVIDTGVDATNPAFGTGTVGQSGNKVVAGVDFTGSPNGISPTWQHGTGVSGLIASTDPTNPGVSPGAGIVALRVFGDDNHGSFDRIAQALDWVVKNHTAYNITAVNLSVSDGGSYTSNQFSSDGAAGQQITADVATLDALNIPVVVAAGNSFDGKTQGQGFASIIPDTISVTSTDETKLSAKGVDVLAADAQRLGAARGGASATDIAAPGVGLVAPAGHSGTATEFGTSFAAPQVTGTVVLLQQMYRRAYGNLPTVAQLDAWLQAGADKVHDSVTGINIGRLNVANSLGILVGEITAQAQTHTTAPVVIAAAELLATPPAVVVPVTVSAPIATPPTSTTTTTTPPEDLATTPATLAVPMTEVIVNGSSVGSVATSKLSSKFAGLFALMKGNVKNLRAWAPAGSTVDLGAVTPTGEEVADRTVRISRWGKPAPSIVTAAVLTTGSTPVTHRAANRLTQPTLATRR